MKRMFCMIIAMILVFSMAIPAFAASITTDWSSTSGGSLGKCKVCGTLNYENSSSAGKDYAQATTKSKAYGKLGARAVIWYTDAGGNTTGHKQSIKDDVTSVSTSKAYAASGCHGYKVTSGHTYSSSDYGTWTKGLAKEF